MTSLSSIYNAETGPNEWISAIITDGTNVLYYGRLLQLDGTTNPANGTVYVDIPPDLPSGEYALKVFNEQYNGGADDNTKQTDYTSRATVVNMSVNGIQVTPSAVFQQRHAPDNLTLTINNLSPQEFGPGRTGGSLEISENGGAFELVDTSKYNYLTPAMRLEIYPQKTWLDTLNVGEYVLRVTLAGPTYAGRYLDAKITVTPADPLPTVDPPETAPDRMVTVAAGYRGTMSVTVHSVAGNVRYQWKIDRNDGHGFVDISGATGESYTTSPAKATHEGYKYYCAVTDNAGSVVSGKFVLHVTPYAPGTDLREIQLGTRGLANPGNNGSDTFAYVFYGINANRWKWRVLDVAGSNEGASLSDGTGTVANSDAMLLFSDSGDYHGEIKYNATTASNDYRTSDVFITLSNKLANDFDVKERSAMLLTTKSDASFTHDGSTYAAATEILKDDKLFILSAEEVLKDEYYQRNTNQWQMFWLRSPDESDTSKVGLFSGASGVYPCPVIIYQSHIRPAFNIKRDAVLFSSAAVGGKDSEGALTAVGANATTEWRLTLDDSANYPNFHVTTSAVSVTTGGGSVDITYAGARTEPRQYLSAMIVDAAGNVLYYGRLKETVTVGDASGTLSVAIPAGLAAGTYTLKVFNEQYNGGANDESRQTDYASAFQDVTLTVVERSAAIGNVTVSGKMGVTIAPTDATITLLNDHFIALAAGTDISGWFTNMPTGLRAEVKTAVAAGDIAVTLTFTGTPTADSNLAIAVTIPASALAVQSNLTLTVNPNARWAIIHSARAATLGNVAVRGKLGEAIAPADATLTLTNDQFVTLAAGMDVSGWFTNMPAGLRAKVKTTVNAGDAAMTVTFSGMPAADSNLAITATIPASALAARANLPLTVNQNARWAITRGGQGGAPKTGDGAAPWLWSALLLMAGMALTACVARKRRKREA